MKYFYVKSIDKIFHFQGRQSKIRANKVKAILYVGDKEEIPGSKFSKRNTLFFVCFFFFLFLNFKKFY